MSGRTRMILAGVVSLLVCLAFFFFFIRPRQSDLSDVKAQVVAEQERTLTLQAELTRLQDLQARAPELEAELARIRQLVPQTHQVPNFIFQVQDAANASGVDFVSITPELPKAPPEGAAVAEVRMILGTGGGYFAVQDFIRRIYDLDRAVRIDNLSLSAEESSTGEITLTVSTAARMFFEVPSVPAPVTETTTTPSETPSPSPS
jgi:Tfp pilus assembly protein PilO